MRSIPNLKLSIRLLIERFYILRNFNDLHYNNKLSQHKKCLHHVTLIPRT